jgi:hypothetical protein
MKRETSVHLYLSLESGTATCVAERVYACLAAWRATCAARDFDLGGGFQHSGNYPMVFLHSGARDFDLGGGFQHSGNYPMVFLHSGVVHSDQPESARLHINFVLQHVHGGTQPCARPLTLITRGIPLPETPRMPNAAPHVCACGGRPLVRGRVAVCGATGERVLATPVSRRPLEWPPRGATPMSRSRLMPPGHRTARGGHTPERDVGPAGLPRSALQSRPMRG